MIYSNNTNCRGINFMESCKTLIDAIDKRIELALKNCKYEYSDTGKVLSISSDRKSASVEIGGEAKTCKMNPTCNVSVGDIVRVIYLQNNQKKAWIDGGSTPQQVSNDVLKTLIKEVLQEMGY